MISKKRSKKLPKEKETSKFWIWYYYCNKYCN